MQKPLYGTQTTLAIGNFPISGIAMPASLIRALALIKGHAAVVNGELGLTKTSLSKAIFDAADTIASGEHADQFPIDIFQTGSGTSTNMNMNEVIATLASRGAVRVHPNDHVNKCQSSNDVIPSTIQLACALAVRDDLLPSLMLLQKTLKKKAREFHGIVKTGRTHLMDAVPLRLGDEFSSYASLLDHSIQRLQEALKRLCILPLGGTAVGTGINAHPQFARLVIARLKKVTKLPLSEAVNHVAAQSCPLAFLSLSSALKETSTAMTKMANDIRLMGSGPVAGLAEIFLPALQAGSSIMPGKVNPVLCESVLQVGMEIVGTDATVQAALAIGSQFELNTAMPITAHVLLSSINHLANVTKLFSEKCIAGITANRKLIADRAARNPMLATALNDLIGYDQSALIAKEAMATGETIFEVAKRRTKISGENLKKTLGLKKML